MPKRSNDFQKFVALIERLAASPTARVIESSLEPESKIKMAREIDILIEDTINGFALRLAIECRDHVRKQDVTWIDELIGKYRDVEVDTIVAVSRSGFTDGALAKARQENIRAYTLKEAVNPGWTDTLLSDVHFSFMEVDPRL